MILRYRPPQVFHVGAGWYCWEALLRERASGGERSDRPLLQFPREARVDPRKREELRAEFARLYKRHLEDDDAEPILEFVAEQLKAERYGAVRDLLRYLAERKDKKRTRLLQKVVASRPWQRFARRLKPRKERRLEAASAG